MEVFWHVIIAVILGVFFILGGYGYGAGIIHLFFAKTEKDKDIIAKSSGEFWVLKEIWLIAGIGLLSITFPLLFDVAFKGFYIYLVIISVLIVLRIFGMRLRSKFKSQTWKDLWYKAFGLSSLLLAFFFGVALGNIIRGVNLGGIEKGYFTLEKNYFLLPFFDASFSPMTTHPGLLDWFTILIGVVSVFVLAIHGANWIVFKTNSSINNQLKSVILILNIALLLLTIVSLVSWLTINPHALNNFVDKPFFGFLPILYFLGIFAMFYVKKFKNDAYGFIISTIILLTGVTTALASIFPVILPSTNSLNKSLTIYNTAATEDSLSPTIGWVIIGLIIIVAYLIARRRILSGKIDNKNFGC